MSNWSESRDSQVSEYIQKMGEEDSYKLVARDVWFSNNQKADIVRYSPENHWIEVWDVYELGTESCEGQKMIESLRKIGSLLDEEGFSYRVSTKRTDNIETVKDVELTGNYYLYPGTDKECLNNHLAGIFASDNFFDDLQPIKGV